MLNKEIKNLIVRWNNLLNCVVFAVEIWNSILPQYSFSVAPNYGDIPMPSYLYVQIENMPDYENNLSVNGGSPIGYYVGDTFYNSLT